MNDFISAVQNQNSASSRNINIQLTDGTYAYINSQGIAKKFNNMAEYEATRGKNGCPADTITVPRTWEDVNFRVGAPMAVYSDNDIMTGQGCGNENRFVASQLGILDKEFDKAYYEKVSQKTFDTIEEATSDWQTSGRVAGLAPFKDAASLHKLGKIGYVDVDSIFHEVPPTFARTYRGPITSYVKGTEMRSCLPPNKVRFRSPIHIKYGDSYLYSRDNSTVKVTASKPSGTDPIFFIQVPITDVKTTGTLPDTLYNQEIAYGDKCIINRSNVWNSPECGFWGCFAGKVFEDTFSLTDSTLSTNLRFVSSTGISRGTLIQYGEQFHIVGEIYKNILRPGDELIKLTNGTYELSFTGGQLIIKNTQTGVNDVLKTSIDPSVDRVMWSGDALNFYSPSNLNPVSTYLVMTTGCETKKCSLSLSNTGLLKVVNALGATIKKSNDAIPETPDIPTTTYAVIVNGELSFTENIEDRSRFSIESTDDSNTCSLNSLQTNCNNTKNCIGFIHSDSENTWQQIKTTDSNNDYKITDMDTEVYLRNVTATLTGENCPTESEPVFMSRAEVSAYPQGKSILSTSENCTQKPKLVIPAFNRYIQGIENTIQIPVESSVGVDKLRGIPDKLQPLLNKYESNYSSWLTSQGNPTPLSNTLQQRITDTYTLDQHYKSMAILWGVITLAMISIILFRSRN